MKLNEVTRTRHICKINTWPPTAVTHQRPTSSGAAWWWPGFRSFDGSHRTEDVLTFSATCWAGHRLSQVSWANTRGGEACWWGGACSGAGGRRLLYCRGPPRKTRHP